MPAKPQFIRLTAQKRRQIQAKQAWYQKQHPIQLRAEARANQKYKAFLAREKWLKSVPKDVAHRSEQHFKTNRYLFKNRNEVPDYLQYEPLKNIYPKHFTPMQKWKSNIGTGRRIFPRSNLTPYERHLALYQKAFGK